MIKLSHTITEIFHFGFSVFILHKIQFLRQEHVKLDLESLNL